MERHAARRVLVFVGGSHRPELEHHLRVVLGASVRSALALGVTADGVRPDTPAPPEVLALWREGAARLRAAAAADAGMRDTLLRKARVLDLAVARSGACCVEPAALDAP